MLKSWKDHYWHSVPCVRRRIETIVEYVQPEGKRIIEIGCNEGFLSKALIEAGAKEVVSVDYDQAMVDKCKEKFGIEAIKADINDIPFADGSFDVALGCEVLEHIANPFIGLQELFRVAREKVVVSVPIGEYWLGELTHQWEINAKSIDHDSLEEYQMEKDLLVMCFDRRRNEDFEDIAPFETKALKKKYNIS